MKFDSSFLKLPIQFDADMLQRETGELPESAWVPHPTGFKGNEAVRLVTVNGGPNDAFDGPMRPTENLARMPYVQQVMATLGGVWTRSRLMGLGPGAEVPTHLDAHYHWRTHMRIHVPITTDPKVLFTCGDETIHMAPGECWLFDSFRWHRVVNGWTDRRVHLVLDTVMTEQLRKLIDDAGSQPPTEARLLPPGARVGKELHFEQVNAPMIMSPWEIRGHSAFILEQTEEHPAIPALRDQLERFADAWAAIWAQFGPSVQGLPAYRRDLAEYRANVAAIATKDVMLTNESLFMNVADALIFVAAIAPAAVATGTVSTAVPRQRFA